MIGRLRGVLVSRRGEVVSIEVGGVGYEVTMTPRGLGALPGVGEEVVVHTHTHVREDGISLYGFAAESDRELFRILLGASGVGPKVAMALLASMSADDIVRAITGEDPDALTVAPGIGTRSASSRIRKETRLLDSGFTSPLPPRGAQSAFTGLEIIAPSSSCAMNQK